MEKFKSFIAEAIEFHVRLDHLEGDKRLDKAVEILNKYEDKGAIKYAGSTDKGIVFTAKKQSDIDKIERELKPTLATVGESVEIEEGVNDPAIFKAIFLAGGPGSGKSFVVGRLGLTAMGYKVVNSDIAFERGLEKAGVEMNPENIFSAQGQAIRDKAKGLTGKQKEMWLKGRLGLVVDGTGKDYGKIKRQKDALEAIGYETAMVFVNTDLPTAIARNKQRERTLPDDTVQELWDEVQKNIGKFSSAFRGNMFIIDNSSSVDVNKGVSSVYSKIKNWTNALPKNSLAKRWIASQK